MVDEYLYCLKCGGIAFGDALFDDVLNGCKHEWRAREREGE